MNNDWETRGLGDLEPRELPLGFVSPSQCLDVFSFFCLFRAFRR
jgi:hypothetical protein